MSVDERDLMARAKPRLRLLDDPALNGEAAPGALDSDLTPVPAFFIRNNGELPEAALAADESWTLTLDGEVERPFSLSLAEIRRRFETVKVTAVMECAGNGRVFYEPPVEGAQWTLGAVGCARWTGVRLADLIAHAGIRPSAVYTAHFSPDRQIKDPSRPAISRGLPIAKALAPETLVAFGMNGEPLHPLHGAPLRIVAPGFPGSAWQKWLTRIILRDREHDGEKMTGTDYRMPVERVDPTKPADPSLYQVITDLPVKSLITSPADGFSLPLGRALVVRGSAWSGHVPVGLVEVSADGGTSWRPAPLAPETERFAWRRFEAVFEDLPAGPVEIVARATDVDGRAQPLANPDWNHRGYLNNRCHRVAGTVTG